MNRNLDQLRRSLKGVGRPPGQILIESLHGAPKDTEPSTGATGFRQAAFNVSVMAGWVDPALDRQQIEWARETAAAIEPWAVSGGYINYMQADEPIERVRAAFGDDAFQRVQVEPERRPRIQARIDGNAGLLRIRRSRPCRDQTYS